jgi:hypothetical protein
LPHDSSQGISGIKGTNNKRYWGESTFETATLNTKDVSIASLKRVGSSWAIEEDRVRSLINKGMAL